MFKMQFDTDNATFNETDRKDEIARVIQEIAQLIAGGALDGIVRDTNGNKIGQFHCDC